MVQVNILVEGATDEPVAKRLLEHVGLAPGGVYGKCGKGDLLKRLPKYNMSARFTPWFVLLDLDDAPCVLHTLIQWLPGPERGMCLRIAVREIESWLLADNMGIADYLAVPLSKIPDDPDKELDPKSTLIALARKSRKKSIRDDLVPREGSGTSVGPLYTTRIIDFARNHWRPDEAATRSESLRRGIIALSKFTTWME